MGMCSTKEAEFLSPGQSPIAINTTIEMAHVNEGVEVMGHGLVECQYAEVSAKS